MPRLNIETSLWSDARFQKLMIKLGDRHRAIGVLVELWTVAQKYWNPDRKLIPEDVWASSELPEAIIECGLAERRSEGIYAKGSEEHFKWWFDRQAAGRKGGLASRQSNRRQLAASTTIDEAKLSKVEQTAPSSSGSSSYSYSCSDSSYSCSVSNSVSGSNSVSDSYSASETSSPLEKEKKTNDRNTRHWITFSDDFEEIYKDYPRNEGKAFGYLNYKKLSFDDQIQLSRAVLNYAKQCKDEGREAKDIKPFSSFMANDFWRDYIDPENQGELRDEAESWPDDIPFETTSELTKVVENSEVSQ